MPYIKGVDKKIFSYGLELIKDDMAFKADKNTDVASLVYPGVSKLCKGDLTYLVFVLARTYFEIKGVSYTNMSDAISALNDAGEEIRRRFLAPYEDKKIEENGDAK